MVVIAGFKSWLLLQAFPWEGGVEKSLFHCPITNPGSEGYLELTEEEEKKYGKYLKDH